MKSEYSTTVTGALAGPLTGVLARSIASTRAPSYSRCARAAK
jgi:hypothetical protein